MQIVHKKELKMSVKIATNLEVAKKELKNENIPLIEIGKYGYIALHGVYGNDELIARTARITTQSDNKNPRPLIRHLMRHWHTSPFENSHIDIEVALPIFIERQWARHRTAGWNEISARYCELPSEQWEIPENRYQSEPPEGFNRQGSGNLLEPIKRNFIKSKINKILKDAVNIYKEIRKEKLAPELSRIVLPFSTYTRKRWWVDLHNCMHFLKLRMDSHAQKEIQEYANALYELIKPHFPTTFEAFEDFRLHSLQLSRLDKKALGLILNGKSKEEVKYIFDIKTEYEEFLNKLENLYG